LFDFDRLLTALCYCFVQARKKVTSKQILDEITERTGVNVIARGTYQQPGKKIDPGERRLYLLIEGSTEMDVKFAKLEIEKALEAETVKLSASSALVGGARYGVL
jgi:ATP-dependent RNA helicase DDX46/PRP5